MYQHVANILIKTVSLNVPQKPSWWIWCKRWDQTCLCCFKNCSFVVKLLAVVLTQKLDMSKLLKAVCPFYTSSNLNIVTWHWIFPVH